MKLPQISGKPRGRLCPLCNRGRNSSNCGLQGPQYLHPTPTPHPTLFSLGQPILLRYHSLEALALSLPLRVLSTPQQFPMRPHLHIHPL